MVAPRNQGNKAAPAELDKSRMQSADETQKQVDAFDAELAELKARYDQYFLGLERIEPIKDRDSFKKRLNALRTSHIRNTGLKFRVQSLWQKYMSFERMWLRIAREIEEGTYSRDLFKARMRTEKRKAKSEQKSDAADDSLQIDEAEMQALEGGDLASALAEATQAVEARKAPPPPPRPVEPPPEPELVRPAPVAQRPTSTPGSARPPPPPAPPAAAAPVRNTGNFAALKGPPPPPPESRPLSNPNAARPPPPPAAAGRPVSNPNAAKPPPPPAAAAPARTVSNPNAPRPPPPPGSAPARTVSNPNAPRPPAPPAARAAATPGAPRPAGGGVPDDKVRAIYNAYVAAKRQCRESTDGLTYEAVAKTINQQTPELMKQHGAKAVDFKVVIKNGKATLKAVPRT